MMLLSLVSGMMVALLVLLWRCMVCDMSSYVKCMTFLTFC